MGGSSGAIYVERVGGEQIVKRIVENHRERCPSPVSQNSSTRVYHGGDSGGGEAPPRDEAAKSRDGGLWFPPSRTGVQVEVYSERGTKAGKSQPRIAEVAYATYTIDQAVL